MTGAVVVDPTTGEVIAATSGDAEEPDLLDATDDVEELRRLAKAYRAQSEGLQRDVEGLEKEARAHRRRIAALEAELKEQRQEADEAPTVRTLFLYWIEKTGRNPKRTKLGPAREKAVLARLREGHAPERIMRAIDGAALGATVSNAAAERQALLRVMRDAVELLSPEQAEELRRTYRATLGNVKRFDDLELICRDETKVERFADLADVIDPLPPAPMGELLDEQARLDV